MKQIMFLLLLLGVVNLGGSIAVILLLMKGYNIEAVYQQMIGISIVIAIIGLWMVFREQRGKK